MFRYVLLTFFAVYPVLPPNPSRRRGIWKGTLDKIEEDSFPSLVSGAMTGGG